MMTAMQNSLGRFKAVLGAGWILLGLAAFLYARMKSIPEWAALPVAAAFLIEFPFYLLPGFDAPRAWLAGQGNVRAGLLLTGSALVPYLVSSIPRANWRLTPFLVLLFIAGVVSFWYVVLPVSPVVDILFLAILGAVLLTKVFDRIYLPPVPKLREISTLGHVMLIRTAVLAILAIRGNANVEFRFLPNRREWISGVRYFAFLIPVAGAAYWALGLVRLRAHPLNPLLALGTFLGILWVVALSEEFFFRGLLQQWLGRWTGSGIAALIIASLLFGSVHLWFDHHFPDWRFAIVAAIAGLFYGMAWRSTRSVQSSMVTHAFTVTLWRVFLQ